MNDLAEKALQGLDVARRQVARRPTASLTVAGFVVSSAVVFTGGVVSAVRPTRSLTTWLGLESAHGSTGGTRPGWLLLAAVTLLVLLWVVTLDVVRRTGLSESRVWVLVAAWTTPFAVGPPLMDTSVYRYAAYGFVQRSGNNPYLSAPSSLRDDPAVLGAIDPASRGTVSGVGPLGSVIQHLAVSVGDGTALGAVIVLRVLGVVAAVAIGRLAVQLAARRRNEALALCALNPLVLLYVVSSPHLDGTMAALVLGALVAAHQRRWSVSVALAALAGSVTPPALVVVAVVVVVHVLGRRSAPAWLVLGRDLGVAALVTLAAGLVQPGGFGWLDAISDQYSSHTPYAVGNAVGRLLSPVVPGASYDDLAASGRITAATAAFCIVVYLLVSARHRSIERTAGYALLATALLAPNLYPWYLLWGGLCLAPTVAGDRRILLVAGSAAACVLVPPGFTGTTSNLVTLAGLLIVAAVSGARWWFHHRQAAPSGAEVGADAS